MNKYSISTITNIDKDSVQIILEYIFKNGKINIIKDILDNSFIKKCKEYKYKINAGEIFYYKDKKMLKRMYKNKILSKRDIILINSICSVKI